MFTKSAFGPRQIRLDPFLSGPRSSQTQQSRLVKARPADTEEGKFQGELHADLTSLLLDLISETLSDCK